MGCTNGLSLRVAISYLTTKVEDQRGNILQFPSPEGLSGGPVVAPEGDGILVGLVRSAMPFLNGWAQWCEPAAEAVRLLVDHEDSAVAAAARHVCERYDDDRATALRDQPKPPPR